MPLAALNLRHVQALVAAARLGSVSAAAGALGISQPAVTQAIARLEALTGTRLLERSRSGARPTDGGILLAARGEAAAAALAAAFRPFRQGGAGGRAGADRDLTMAQLQALIALDESGSYVAGAAATGLSEASLHRAVSELERRAGISLTQRQGRGVAITEAGRRLARACRIAAAELSAGLDELAVLGGRDQGVIRVGAERSVLEALVSRAVGAFLKEHPPVIFELIEAGTAEVEALRSGRLDMLVGPEDAVSPNAYEIERLTSDELVVAGRRDHPLAAVAAPGLARLAACSWALPPPDGILRQRWDRLFLDGGLFPPPVSVTCAAPAALARLAAASDLLTLLPARALGTDLVAIGPAVAGLALSVFTRSGWYPTPAQAAFLEELRAAASIVQF